MGRLIHRRRSLMLSAAAVSMLLILGIVVFLQMQTSLASRTGPRRIGHPNLSKQLRQSVEVIGHRGNPDVAPENTLASFTAAFAAGATMVEADVHLSRDGIPVIIHDDTLERTTNGKGPVAAMTLAQLSVLDAGSWKGRAYAGERIPSLAAILRAAKGKGRLLLDLKVDGMAATIAKVVRSGGLANDVLVVGAWTEAQANDAVAHLKGAEILMTDAVPKAWDEAFFERQRARGVTGFEIPRPWSAEFIAAAHRHGMPVYAYTINDEPTMRALIAMGVDGIETDVPAQLVHLLEELTKSQK